MKTVTIYTDGACSYNPGPGGWCAILQYNDKEKVISGGDPSTTNNRMELSAVIEGLSALNQKCTVNLYSDSSYIVDAFNNDRLTLWQSLGWRTADKKPVKNLDLWQRLVELTNYHTVNFIKVKGHADNPINNRCDKIARTESLKFPAPKKESDVKED